MTALTPDALADRYDDEPYRKADRLEVSAERFERATARGDDGSWGVGALVVDDGRALFVREGDTWLLPGGRLETDERPAAGAVREVAEETGIDVEVRGLAAIAEQTFVHEETGESFEFHFATFLAEPADTSAEPAPSDPRTDEAAWLSAVPEDTFDRELVERLFDAHV